MNIADTIFNYRVLQATAEAMANSRHSDVTWLTGQPVAVYDFDLDVELVKDEVHFSGTDAPGIYYSFSIPASVFQETAEARLAVLA